MGPDFDRVIDRRNTDSNKWHKFPPDVLPLWVADMDFPSPPVVVDALRRRVEHGFFGYLAEHTELPEIVVDRLNKRYGWRVSPEAVMPLPGVIAGFNLALRALTRPGDGLLIQTPVYPPILRAAGNHGLVREDSALARSRDGRYTVDRDSFAATISDRTRAFLLCNPHNPVGRVFERAEVEAMAAACHRRGLWIIADEIHCELLLDGRTHVPMASLSPEIEQRTVTLMAPSKTFNLPGLKCAIGIVPNPALRERLTAAVADMVPKINVLGHAAAVAAYRDGDSWLRSAPALPGEQPRLPRRRACTPAARREDGAGGRNLPGVARLPRGTHPRRRPVHVLPGAGQGRAQRRQAVRAGRRRVRAAQLRVSARAPHRGPHPHGAGTGMKRYVDLSVTVDDTTLSPPSTNMRLEVTPHRRGPGFWQVSSVHQSLHTGAHIDSPLHVFKDGITTAEIALDQVMGEAIVVDLSFAGANHKVTIDDLKRGGADAVKPGDIVLLRTDWTDKMYGRWPDYFTQSPYCPPETAEWLVAKGPKNIGFDFFEEYCARLPDFSSEDFPMHRVILGAGIVIMEGLTNLAALPARRVDFAAPFYKIAGTEGAPARFFAIVD